MSDLRTHWGGWSSAAVARALKVDGIIISRQSVGEWYKNNTLPRTEYLPDSDPANTRYAKTLEKLFRCKAHQLLYPE